MAMSFHQPYAAQAPLAMNPRLVSHSDGEDDEIWHVAISDDDVKTMTLEQLDDAFRLDIIDSQTPVWKDGMGEWQPLGVIAGIESEEEEEEEEEEVSATHVVVIAPPVARRPTPSPPVPLKTLPTAPTKTSWPPSSFSLAGPPSAFKPPPVVAPPAPSVSAVRSTAHAPVFDTPRSISPAAFTIPAPLVRPSQPSTVGRWLLGLAFVSGLTLTLYRNDVLLQLARSVRLESQFLRAERALVGGPSFGTARALERSTWSNAVLSNIASSPSLTNAAAPSVPPSMPDTSTRTLAVENLALENSNPPSSASPKERTETTSEVTAKKATNVASSSEKAEKAEKPAKTESSARSAGVTARADRAPVAPSPPAKSAAKRKSAAKVAAAAEASETRSAPPKERKSAASARAEAPAHTAPEPRRASTPKSKLLEAIGESLRKQKSKGPNSDYDPMNGSL